MLKFASAEERTFTSPAVPVIDQSHAYAREDSVDQVFGIDCLDYVKVGGLDPSDTTGDFYCVVTKPSEPLHLRGLDPSARRVFTIAFAAPFEDAKNTFRPLRSGFTRSISCFPTNVRVTVAAHAKRPADATADRAKARLRMLRHQVFDDGVVPNVESIDLAISFLDRAELTRPGLATLDDEGNAVLEFQFPSGLFADITFRKSEGAEIVESFVKPRGEPPRTFTGPIDSEEAKSFLSKFQVLVP